MLDSTAHRLLMQSSSPCVAAAGTSAVSSPAAAQVAAKTAQQETQRWEVFSSASGLTHPCPSHSTRRGRPGPSLDPIGRCFRGKLLDAGRDSQAWAHHLDLPICRPVCRHADNPAYPQQEATDLMGYLLRNRIIFIGSRIGDDVSPSPHIRARLCFSYPAAWRASRLPSPLAACIGRWPLRWWPAYWRWRRSMTALTSSCTSTHQVNCTSGFAQDNQFLHRLSETFSQAVCMPTSRRQPLLRDRNTGHVEDCQAGREHHRFRTVSQHRHSAAGECCPGRRGSGAQDAVCVARGDSGMVAHSRLSHKNVPYPLLGCSGSASTDVRSDWMRGVGCRQQARRASAARCPTRAS